MSEYIGYVIAGLTGLAFFAWPALYVWTKRRAFWRDYDEARDFMTEDGVFEVMRAWVALRDPGAGPYDAGLFIYVVREDEEPTGRARTLLAEGWRPGGTTVWGVTSPSLRYEYGMAWLTRLLKGAGPVYEIAVREKLEDPEGARALAHELAHHVWPHLHGWGWNRSHDLGGGADRWPDTPPDLATIEAKLLEGLK